MIVSVCAVARGWHSSKVISLKFTVFALIFLFFGLSVGLSMNSNKGNSHASFRTVLMTRSEIVRIRVDEVVTLIVPPAQQENSTSSSHSSKKKSRETVAAQNLYRFEVINSVVGLSYTMMTSPADSSRYDLHLRFSGQVEPSCGPYWITQTLFETCVPSFQKTLLSNVGSRILRFDRCLNEPIFGGIRNLNSLYDMSITITFSTIQYRGQQPPCKLGPLVPGYAFEREVFTSPIISDFQVDVSNRRNIGTSIPTILQCAWVYLGEIPTRQVRVEVWNNGNTIVASSDIIEDVGTVNVTLTSSFPNSKDLKLKLVHMTGISSQTLIESERFFSFGANVAPVSSSPLRLAATLAVDSYGIMREELQSFDGGIESFYVTVLSSAAYTARTNLYVSNRRNLVVISQRGTVGVTDDWDVNYNTLAITCSNIVAGCLGQTTQGLATEYALTATSIKDKLILIGATNLTKEFTFLVTGHSQGAALAALTALDLSLTFQIPQSRMFLVTLGLPVFADTTLAAQLQSRVTNFAQLVTRDQILAPDAATLYSKYVYGTNFILSPVFPQHYLSYTRLAKDDPCISSNLCPIVGATCGSCFSDLNKGNLDAHQPRNYLEQVIINGQTGGSNLDPLPPLNDFCQFPDTLAAQFIYHLNALRATSFSDPQISCNVEVTATIWFQFSPQITAFYTFDTCFPETTVEDTVVSIYEGACQNLTLLACNDNVFVGSSCDGTFKARAAGVPMSQGKTYLIALSVKRGIPLALATSTIKLSLTKDTLMTTTTATSLLATATTSAAKFTPTSSSTPISTTFLQQAQTTKPSDAAQVFTTNFLLFFPVLIMSNFLS